MCPVLGWALTLFPSGLVNLIMGVGVSNWEIVRNNLVMCKYDSWRNALVEHDPCGQWVYIYNAVIFKMGRWSQSAEEIN